VPHARLDLPGDFLDAIMDEVHRVGKMKATAEVVAKSRSLRAHHTVDQLEGYAAA
jgi:hypothetical protein